MNGTKTFLTGLLGEGIAASRSPEIHQSEAKALGITLIYRTIDFKEHQWSVTDLPDVLTAAENFGFNGLNITHPYKQAVLPLLNELSEEASAIGSVNTVVFSSGRRIGYNTDWYGFTESFKIGLADVPIQNVVLIGAGGAGVAVGYALLRLGIQDLFIVDINNYKAEDLALRLLSNFTGCRTTAVADAGNIITQADGIVQTTPVGMSSYPGMPFDADLLGSHQWLAEIIYFPIETEILKYARSISCKTISGGGMAVHQAAKAFELFTGVKPDVERMVIEFAKGG